MQVCPSCGEENPQGRLYLEGNFAAAANVFGGMGALTNEAFARLRAAEFLVAAGSCAEADAELSGAMDFYRRVGATAYIRRGEALLAATA